MTVPYLTDPALPARLQSNLRPGEGLLWCGQPDPSVLFTPADGFLIPFSILWLSFAVFWEAGVWSSGLLIGRIWGIPFIAIGLYYLVGRFVYKRYRKRRTVYGVTRERAVIAVGRSFSDMPLKTVSISVHRSRSGRRASVTFGDVAGQVQGVSRRLMRRRASYGAFYANTGLELMARGGTLMPFAFYDVAEPDAMLAALDQARTSDRTSEW